MKIFIREAQKSFVGYKKAADLEFVVVYFLSWMVLEPRAKCRLICLDLDLFCPCIFDKSISLTILSH